MAPDVAPANKCVMLYPPLGEDPVTLLHPTAAKPSVTDDEARAYALTYRTGLNAHPGAALRVEDWTPEHAERFKAREAAVSPAAAVAVAGLGLADELAALRARIAALEKAQ